MPSRPPRRDRSSDVPAHASPQRAVAWRWALLAALVAALILVPFALWEQPMASASEQLLHTTSGRAAVFGLVVVLLLADLALPVPSSFIAAAAAAALGTTLGALSIWLGLTLSAALGYALGRFGGEPLVQRWVGAEPLQRAQRLLERHGVWVLLVCRGAPVLAEASTLFAGAVRLAPARFFAVVALGNLGLALAYSSAAAVSSSETFAVLWPFALGVVIPALLLWGASRSSASRRR